MEDFIRDNRDAFDDKEPSEKLWKKIESSLFLSRGISLWSSVNLWRAAAVLFMALSLYLLIPVETGPKQSAALTEFRDIENFYIQQISEKTELIEEFYRSEGLNGFTNDFKQLEAMYMVLKEEMKNRPSKRVKDALVLNLLVRIDLLNQQLHKLENDEYREGENDPETDKRKA